MRRNPDFLARKVAGKFLLVPVGHAADSFTGMITINGSGAFLWEKLEEEQTVESLAQALTEHYEVDLARARADVEKFIEPLIPAGAILE